MTGDGLCGTCRHKRLMVSDRGSVFLRCERAKADSAYPKYPPLPVWQCAGYEADTETPPAGSSLGPAGNGSQ